MSGYSSRAEVVRVVKATIVNDTNSTGFPRDPRCFNVSGLVRDNFTNAGRYGWRATTNSEEFVASLYRHFRTSCKS